MRRQYVARKTVEGATGPDHVSPGLPTTKGRGGICRVNVRGTKTSIAKERHGRLKSIQLSFGKLLVRVIISRRQMRHQTVNANVLELFEPIAKLGY